MPNQGNDSTKTRPRSTNGLRCDDAPCSVHDETNRAGRVRLAAPWPCRKSVTWRISTIFF